MLVLLGNVRKARFEVLPEVTAVKYNILARKLLSNVSGPSSEMLTLVALKGKRQSMFYYLLS
jgi:hypothetical protein